MSRVWSVLLAVALAAAALAPVGCRSNQGAGGKTVVRIGHLPITDHLTVIAKTSAEFPNVDLQLVKFGGWAEIAEAIRAEAIDGAFLLAPLGLSLRQQGVPIRAVLLGHRNGSVVIVKNSPDIQKPADLRGRTVAIPSRFSTHNILIRRLLSENKLEADRDVTLVDMKPPEMVNALATGRIDAFIVAEPFGGQAEMQEVGKILVLSKDVWAGHICCVLHVREAVIEEHPEAVQEVVSGLVSAARLIENDPSEAARLSTPYLGQKPEVIEHVLLKPKGRVTYADLTPKVADFEATMQELLRFKILTEKVDLTGYVDDRFARKAYKGR
jgi:NitT/TauT family transport system substrate-binding protein